MTNLYQDYHTDPKADAQRNLTGRTHYVDDDNLKHHRCRITAAFSTAAGLFYAIVTSDALDARGATRGFRYVVFDVFGHVVARTKLEDAYSSTKAATRALWRELNALDPFMVTRAAVTREVKIFNRDIVEFTAQIDHIEKMVKEA